MEQAEGLRVLVGFEGGEVVVELPWSGCGGWPSSRCCKVLGSHRGFVVGTGELILHPFVNVQLVKIAADLAPKGCGLVRHGLDGEPPAQAVQIRGGFSQSAQLARQMRDDGSLDDDVVVELGPGAVVLHLRANLRLQFGFDPAVELGPLGGPAVKENTGLRLRRIHVAAKVRVVNLQGGERAGETPPRSARPG